MSLDFSIIIPTYNRPAALRRCLQWLAQLRYPKDRYDVWVVDDGSTLSYEALRSEFPEVHWLRQENTGPALARNLGARHAPGRVLAFTDDDCLVDPGWLCQLAEAFAETPAALVGGTTPAYADAGFYDQVSQFITAIVYRHYNHDPSRAQFFASNNLAIDAGVFWSAGGFNGVLTRNAAEDRTLCNKVLSLGYPLRWQKQAVVEHLPELDLRRFCRMYFRYGRGAWTFQRSRSGGTMLEETSFHLRLPWHLVREFREHPELPRATTLLLLGVWQAGNLAGFLWQSWRRGAF